MLEAWIEMISKHSDYLKGKGRLLCWRRGLKCDESGKPLEWELSPPLLEAWIEIMVLDRQPPKFDVASFVGGVD